MVWRCFEEIVPARIKRKWIRTVNMMRYQKLIGNKEKCIDKMLRIDINETKE